MMTSCREWQGYRTPLGYGYRTLVRFKSRFLHRQIMEMVYGHEALEGKVVRHICDNPPCFRFDHLRIGTTQDNVDDKMAKGRWNNGRLARTHCVNGHEFDEENTGYRSDGSRVCKPCALRRAREHKAKALA